MAEEALFRKSNMAGEEVTAIRYNATHREIRIRFSCGTAYTRRFPKTAFLFFFLLRQQKLRSRARARAYTYAVAERARARTHDRDRTRITQPGVDQNVVTIEPYVLSFP